MICLYKYTAWFFPKDIPSSFCEALKAPCYAPRVPEQILRKHICWLFCEEPFHLVALLSSKAAKIDILKNNNNNVLWVRDFRIFFTWSSGLFIVRNTILYIDKIESNSWKTWILEFVGRMRGAEFVYESCFGLPLSGNQRVRKRTRASIVAMIQSWWFRVNVCFQLRWKN